MSTAVTGLGRKIRSLRDEMAISQAQLAAHAGLSQGYLSQLENDEVQNPSAAVIFRLAQALNVDPQVLMHAAGYKDVTNGGKREQYSVTVDPELLRFLTGIPREEHKHLLRFLKSLAHKDERTAPAAGNAAGAAAGS